MPKFEQVLFLELAASDVAFLVSTSLKRLGWEQLYVNEVMRTITGHMAKRMTMSGLNWNFDFHMVLQWQETEGGVSLAVTVQERTYAHSLQECKKLYCAFSEALMQDLETIAKADRVKQEGARWATMAEIEMAGYLGELEDDDHRQLVVAAVNDKWLRLPAASTNRHALVCGPTGSGKTTGVFIPNLIERTNSSAIVTEATGARGVADLFQKTAGYRRACGHKIYYFNPDDLTSSRINPLDRVKTIRQAWRVVEILMQTTTMANHRGDQSWELSERLLLAALIMHVVGERASGRCNLGYVAELLEEGSDALEEVVGKSKVPFARRFYNTFWKNSTDKYRNLVAAGLVSRLKVFYYPTIRELTSTTDVPFNRLNQELFTFYISVAADNHELKPVAALMLNLALGILAEGKSKHPLMLLLDEFTNFGYIRGFPSKLTIMRHDKIPVVLGVQDLIQLDNTYGPEAKTLRSQPSTRIFFRPNDPDTAMVLSKALGEYVREEATVTSTGQIQKSKDRKMLLTPDELLNLGAIDERSQVSDRPTMICFLPATRPAILYAAGWQDYQRQCDSRYYPVPKNPERVVDDNLVAGFVEEQEVSVQDFEECRSIDPVEAFISEVREQSLRDEHFQYPPIWYEPVVVSLTDEGNRFDFVLGPESAISELESVIDAYENNLFGIREHVSEKNYCKMVAWWERATMLQGHSGQGFVGVDGNNEDQEGNDEPQDFSPQEIQDDDDEMDELVAALFEEPVSAASPAQQWDFGPVSESNCTVISDSEENYVDECGFGGAWD